jgi:hypothetical protein
MYADDHQNDQLQKPEDVRIVGARVGAVEEFAHARYTQYAVDADDDATVDAETQVKKIGRHETGDVETELSCADVLAPQLGGVANYKTLLEVRCTSTQRHTCSSNEYGQETKSRCSKAEDVVVDVQFK